MNFTQVKKSRALKPLEQDPKAPWSSTKMRRAVYLDLAKEWMHFSNMFLFGSQKLITNVDGKLYGLYRTSGK